MGKDIAGKKFSILKGQHELTVRRCTVSVESIEVAYRVTPPLPERWRDEPDGSLAEAGPPIFLSVEAVDDLGGEYLDGGGAFGTDAEGRFTEGTLTVQPAPPPTAKSLTLTLMLRCGDQQSTLHLEMPL
ncbi:MULTISPECIES: hypothetical protein [Streptomyces]|uniref:Uncharacterized protein n=1 Tax=Streptomyces nigrescens TaxID=1920 RepID=A0ABY7ISZ3_STRNI|nr:hypothetical protein [Streptomyces nigrescens]WAU02072.1 hypothetical protein STRNI_000022 [Streptomyces nigrescens]